MKRTWHRPTRSTIISGNWQLAIGARDTRRDDTLTGIPRGQPLPEVRPAAVAGAGD